GAAASSGNVVMQGRARAVSHVLITHDSVTADAALRAAAPSPSPPPPPAPPPELHIARTAGAITIDGNLDDAGWKGVLPVETWFETNPGDNVPPAVKNVGYVTYDDRFFYAAFDFQDPDPRQMRAPL